MTSANRIATDPQKPIGCFRVVELSRLHPAKNRSRSYICQDSRFLGGIFWTVFPHCPHQPSWTEAGLRIIQTVSVSKVVWVRFVRFKQPPARKFMAVPESL